jgi:DNA-binding GntR family transcriptional regulator
MIRSVSVSVSVSVSNPAVTKNKIVTEHIEEESVTERIVTQIRDKIICGDLPPGTPLTEADLTKAYDVSRNTLREALRQICREGLAVHYRHRGVVVRTLTRTDVRDIFRVRRTLELQAIALPAKPDPAVLHAMAAACDAAAQAASQEDWRSVGTHSLRFHQHIVEMIGSALLDQFFRTILAQLRLLFSAAPDERRFQLPWIERDRELYDLIVAGEHKRASKKLSDYLDRSEEALIDLL